MSRITGKHALLQTLPAENVRYIFGNPGTSESGLTSILPEYSDMDFALPLNPAIAGAMGVDGRTVTDPAELTPSLQQALDAGRPALLDVIIDGAV